MSLDPQYDKQEIYQISVKGLLGQEWSDWFDGLDIVPRPGGETLLTGPVRDQSALYGLLNKLRDLGLPLLSLRRVEGKE